MSHEMQRVGNPPFQRGGKQTGALADSPKLSEANAGHFVGPGGHWPPCETEAYQEQLGVAPPVARTHRQQGLTEIGLFLCAQTLQPNNGPKKSVYPK